jgi:heptaprenylglyceryl phosphate synthase
VRAGADIVVTGTVAEFSHGRGELLAKIVGAVRKG